MERAMNAKELQKKRYTRLLEELLPAKKTSEQDPSKGTIVNYHFGSFLAVNTAVNQINYNGPSGGYIPLRYKRLKLLKCRSLLYSANAGGVSPVEHIVQFQCGGGSPLVYDNDQFTVSSVPIGFAKEQYFAVGLFFFNKLFGTNSIGDEFAEMPPMIFGPGGNLVTGMLLNIFPFTPLTVAVGTTTSHQMDLQFEILEP